MLKNYLKLALRNAGRHKWYTFINVLGLAVGMASCILILLWVQHELSFDRFHRQGDLIYQVVVEDPQPVGVTIRYGTPRCLGDYLETHFPEIDDATNYLAWECTVESDGKVFTESGAALVNPHLFYMFNFPVVSGSPDNLMPDNHSVVLSRHLARKYFGATPPLGRTLRIDGTTDLTVTGVIDLPDNSTIRGDFFIPFEAPDLSRDPYLDERYYWRSLRVTTYVLLTEHADPAEVERKIAGILQKFNPDKKWTLKLRKFSDIYLFGLGNGDSRIQNIFLFLSIGIFILMIGCINFINLATARSERRAQEVGLRKTVGAFRPQIIRQFFAESTVQTVMAFFLGMVLVECFLPAFNGLSGKALDLSLFDVNHILILAGVIIMTAIGSGGYTALFLSSRDILDVLRGGSGAGRRKTSLRKVLVIFQFFLATLLIIGTLTVYSQLRFMQTKDLGLERENLFYINLVGKSIDTVSILKQELRKYPGIVAASVCDRLPTLLTGFTNDVKWEGKSPDDRYYFSFTGTDTDYLDALGLKLVKGRMISDQIPGDEKNLIINEEAAKRIGIDPIIGARVTMWGHVAEVVGVVEDFNFQPLQNKILPLLITTAEGRLKSHLLVRVAQGNVAGSIESLKRAWKKVNPGVQFEAHSMSHAYSHLYDNEERLATLLLYFSGMAVILSGLGLLGLTSFTAEQRIKEFGIRKILGASTWEIFVLLLRQYSLWVLCGVCSAWPVGYWLTGQWLRNFAYRVTPGIGNFFIASFIALLIAFVATSFQAIRTSRAQPVDSLRYE